MSLELDGGDLLPPRAAEGLEEDRGGAAAASLPDGGAALGPRPRRFYGPTELKRVTEEALGERMLDWLFLGVFHWLRHPDAVAPFVGAWRSEDGITHDLAPPESSNLAMRFLVATQLIAFTRDPASGEVQCRISTTVAQTRPFGTPAFYATKRDVLRLKEVVYGPDGPGLEANGVCSYLATHRPQAPSSLQREPPTQCAYTFWRRGARLLVELRYLFNEELVERSYLTSRDALYDMSVRRASALPS